MEKHYVKPSLEITGLWLTDVIMYSPPQQETYEVPIRKIIEDDMAGDNLPENPPQETE